MKLRIAIIWLGLVVLLLQESCKSPTGPEGVSSTPIATSIRGTVKRSDNLAPIAGARVSDTKGLATDTSKIDGSYKLTYLITSQTFVTIFATANGFGRINTPNDTVTVAINPGIDTAGIAVVLGADTSSPISSGVPGSAASIVLTGSSLSTIAIRGTGANESSLMTFEVRDSLGNPLNLLSKTTVRFWILGGPGGGEYVFPISAVTDEKGKVSTQLTSGTKAGVLQVYASTRNDSVKSSPVRVTIASGLPDPGHFSFSRDKVNLAGGVYDNLRANFQVIVGDKYGNPVQAGTAVYFTTTGGIIPPTGLTGSDGITSVSIITGNPRPAGGVALVTARTIGDSGTGISATLPITFSGKTLILAPSAAFVIPDSGSYGFAYQVQDAFGNPLVAGSSIKVSVSGPGAGSLAVQGDKNVTLPDTQDTTYTNFACKIVDNARGGVGGIVTVTIDVTSQNGNASYSFSGLLLSTGGGGGGGGGGFLGNPTADKIVPFSISKPTIAVNDGSNSDQSITTVTFVVKDSAGNLLINPLNPSAAKVYVIFAVIPSDGVSGGESLLITADSTNEFAQVSTKLLAGTKSGLFYIKASTVVIGKGVISSGNVDIVIKAGPPDPAHFALGPRIFNFPGLDVVAEGVTNNIAVSLADRYSNPVPFGTRIYFNATNLSVEAEAATDVNGFCQATQFAAGKKPEGANLHPGLSPGFMRLYARVDPLVAPGQIIDSLLLVVTGRPILTKTGGPATYTIANGGNAGVTWTFTIVDRLGNPLSSGTSITVTAPGGAVDGDASIILPDALVGGPGITTFGVQLRDQDPNTTTVPPFNGTLTVTVLHPTYGTYTLPLATGTIQ